MYMCNIYVCIYVYFGACICIYSSQLDSKCHEIRTFLNSSCLYPPEPDQCLAQSTYSVNIFELMKENLMVELEIGLMLYGGK